MGLQTRRAAPAAGVCFALALLTKQTAISIAVLAAVSAGQTRQVGTPSA